MFTTSRGTTPRNPENPPKLQPGGFEPLDSKQWNHILYGERDNKSFSEAPKGKGGHYPGFGWIFEKERGVPRTEFPEDWSRDDIAGAIEEVLDHGEALMRGHRTLHRKSVDGVVVRVVTSRRKNGMRFISTAHPE
ncbi:EndoU domain-containing protein [Auritidibacter ignavus]|uniref:EndoU domain-containing protein n=1 Tax=Auritidibacter ignavus TaxID=678932 RepID=UPI003CC564F2